MSGYIYCFSNESMPGILKIGISILSPKILLKQSNILDIWRPPTPYINEISLRVSNIYKKEANIISILENHKECVVYSNGFYKISLEHLKHILGIIDDLEYTVDYESGYDSEYDSDSCLYGIEKCRKMDEILINGQKIRHRTSKSAWIGTYDLENNNINYNNESFASLNSFAIKHHIADKTGKKNIDGWEECECQIDNKWWVSAGYKTAFF